MYSHYEMRKVGLTDLSPSELTMMQRARILPGRTADLESAATAKQEAPKSRHDPQLPGGVPCQDTVHGKAKVCESTTVVKECL